jgi:hypothetical protein
MKMSTPGTSDCLQCKIIGCTTFSGLSIYALNLHRQTPKNDKTQRIFLLAFATGAAGMAIARYFVD